MSSESFAYLFKEQDLDNKVKNGLLMLAKDLKYKYGFPALIVRPQAMLTTNYVNVPPALEKEFLRQFGDYAQPMGTVPDRVISSRRQGSACSKPSSTVWMSSRSPVTSSTISWKGLW